MLAFVNHFKTQFSWFIIAGLIIRVDDVEDRTDWFYNEATALGDSLRFQNLLMTKVNGSLRVQFNSGNTADNAFPGTGNWDIYFCV